MAKKEIVIDYGATRVLLSTVAAYLPIYNGARNSITKHGIRFHLRTGEIIEQLGDDEVSRDKVLAFIDVNFKPTKFTANRCTVCSNYTGNGESDYCATSSCSEWENYPKFERKKETANADLSNNVPG
jgi:hypothetical protein